MRIVKPGGIAMPGILGKVKVGGKAVNPQGKEYPVSLDHFRFTSNESHRVQRCVELFGEKPTKLPITFHSNDPNVVCSQRYEFRNSAGQLVADGDGVNFRQSTKEQGMVSVSPDNGEDFMKWLKGKDPKGDWKEVLILRFMLLNYPEYGLWEFRTAGDETSIPQIIGSFDAVMELGGRVKGVPFWLTVQKCKSNRSEVARQYPVVNLTCDLSVEMVEMVNGRDIRGLVTAEKLQSALPSGEPQTGNHIEDAEIVDEIPHSDEALQEPLIVTVTEQVTTEPPLNDPAFLAEIQKPVPLASEQVGAPEIPDLNDLPETKSFEQDPEWELVLDADERYNKLVAYLIEKGMTAQDLEQFQTTRKVRFQTNFHAHLGNIIWYREELLKPVGGAFSLRDILNQTDTTEAEKPLWEALAKMNGLK